MSTAHPIHPQAMSQSGIQHSYAEGPMCHEEASQLDGPLGPDRTMTAEYDPSLPDLVNKAPDVLYGINQAAISYPK